LQRHGLNGLDGRALTAAASPKEVCYGKSSKHGGAVTTQGREMPEPEAERHIRGASTLKADKTRHE